jgi:hypothetical protein
MLAGVAEGQALAGIFAPSPPAQPVHHGGGEALAVADHVAHLIEIADEACFLRGSDAPSLAAWAQVQHWRPVAAEDLKNGLNEFTTLVAGWTFETRFSAFAVVQSRLNAPHDGYVCSITTKLASASQHGETKAAIQNRFGMVIERETDRLESHTDHFWIERGEKPVKVTLVYAPATGRTTIRMIHGNSRPVRS